MYDIITMGSNTVDVFAHTDQSEVIKIRSKKSYRELISYPVGAKMLITTLMHNLGGNGTNSAVAFSRLGLKTAYLGKIGKDANGKLILESLRKHGIDFIGARGDESGFSIVLDSIEHDRTILTFKGCNNDLDFDEISKPRLRTKWIYLSTMLGKSLKTMQKVVKLAKSKGVMIAFNPSATMLDKETKAAINILRYVDVLVLNKEEAESLVGRASKEANIKKLLVYGPKMIAITDGKIGVVAYNDGHFYKVCPKEHLKVMESTGAGDSFSSTLTAGLAMGKPFEYCLKMAINNSESVITHHGAQNLLLTRRKLFEAVNKDRRRIEKSRA